MDYSALFDPISAAVVVGGTIAATMLRSGADEQAATLYALARLGRRFNLARRKAEVAGPVADMRQDGVLRAHFDKVSDRHLRKMVDALVHDRSLVAMLDVHAKQRGRRFAIREKAFRTLYQAGELAPVLGLAGTLLSLSLMPTDEMANGSLTNTVGMAVLTTLYGLIAANFIFLPLARAVERNGEREERDRQALADWIAAQLAQACPATAQRKLDRPANPVTAAGRGSGSFDDGTRAA